MGEIPRNRRRFLHPPQTPAPSESAGVEAATASVRRDPTRPSRSSRPDMPVHSTAHGTLAAVPYLSDRCHERRAARVATMRARPRMPPATVPTFLGGVGCNQRPLHGRTRSPGPPRDERRRAARALTYSRRPVVSPAGVPRLDARAQAGDFRRRAFTGGAGLDPAWASQGAPGYEIGGGRKPWPTPTRLSETWSGGRPRAGRC